MHHIVSSLPQENVSWKKMQALEQDNLSEIKFDLGFFLSVFSQRGNRGQPGSSLENEFLLRQEEGVGGRGGFRGLCYTSLGFP